MSKELSDKLIDGLLVSDERIMTLSSNEGVEKLLLNDAIFNKLLTIVDWCSGIFVVVERGVVVGGKVEVEAS